MYPTDKERKGSVTLEAAVCAPVMLAVFLFIYGILEMFLLYNCVSKAMYDTADIATSYGVLYHENGIGRLEKNLQDKLAAYMDFNWLLTYGDDLLYQNVAEIIFEHQLEQDAVYNRFFRGRLQYEFTGSSFFNEGSEIILTGHFKCDYTIPFAASLLKGFSLDKTLVFYSFTEGVTSEFNTGEQLAQSVWSLSNFERGQILQKKFGRNLPQFFPVIDYYKSGTVGIIRSMNHTLNTYQDASAFERVLDELSAELIAFEGASYSHVSVNGNDISKREIILIFPEDDFTSEQQDVVERFVKISARQGVQVTVQRYERTVAK